MRAEDMIDTRPFAARCALRTEWPTGAMHRVQYVDVRAGDLPADVRERLRQAGCGPWVDEDGELIPLGEAVIVGTDERGGVVGLRYGPRPRIPVAELVARVRSGPTPAERREQERQRRELEERRRAEALARGRAEDDCRLAAARERAEREAEAERRRQAFARSIFS